MSRAGGGIPGGACVKSGASGLQRTGRRGKGNRFDGAGSLGTGSSMRLGRSYGRRISRRGGGWQE